MENSGGCVGWMLMLDVEHGWTFPGDADQWGNERSSPRSGHPLPVLPVDPGRGLSVLTLPFPKMEGPSGVLEFPGRWSQGCFQTVSGLLPFLTSDCWVFCTLEGLRETVWGRRNRVWRCGWGDHLQSPRPLVVGTEPSAGWLLLHLRHDHAPLLADPEFLICTWLSGHRESIFVHQRLKYIYQLICMI